MVGNILFLIIGIITGYGVEPQFNAHLILKVWASGGLSENGVVLG